ncbi:hypothetical protein V7201_10730 [Bacillus sp. JJ1122]|uniref:hypothetical protein n=1 Tax=Bacillus sp. JJ1122 TaxID=3122951 RepID=UPI002FFEC927
MILDLLRANGSIVVNKNLVHAIGIDAAILYSELISKQEYFQDRDQLTDDGYFFNTVDNIKLDTGLGEKPQRAAIKKLESLGLIRTDKRGLPAKRYFKVIPDEKNITRILLAGREQRLALENDLKGKNEQKKAVYSSNINSSSQTAELDKPNGSINNTKINNPKEKIKKIYIISQNDASVFSYYSKRFEEIFGKEHPTMTEEKMNELDSNYSSLSSDLDIDEDTWIELVDYHFENLPKSNNGNILAFLAPNGGHSCIYRYMEEMSYEDTEEVYTN